MSRTGFRNFSLEDKDPSSKYETKNITSSKATGDFGDAGQ